MVPQKLLAIDGGTPVRSQPLPVRIQFDYNELQAVTTLFERAMCEGGGFDRYGIGPQARGTIGELLIPQETEVDQFEADLARYFGVAHVTAVSSGTAAIHAALMALQLEPGTEVITSTLTDPGVVMAILSVLCVPVFADHDYETVLPTVATIEAVFSKYTGAIIVTHLMGLVCDMEPIMHFARRHGISVIGDAAQAHGSTYGGSRSVPFGHIGVVSMMSTKHITCGGQGGFVATDDASLYLGAKRFADRGKSFALISDGILKRFGGDRVALGLNYRMTELEATIGRVQLTKLDFIMTRRRQVKDVIHSGIEGFSGIRPVAVVKGVDPNPWALLFLLNRDRLIVDATHFAAAVSAEGVAMSKVIPELVPVVDESSFVRSRTTFGTSDLPYGLGRRDPSVSALSAKHPNVDRLSGDLVAVWIHEGWTPRDEIDTIEAIRKVNCEYAKR